MVKRWISAVEIANVLGITKRGVNKRARNEQWQNRSIKANGGMTQVFQLEFLPDDIQTAYAASLSMDLQALKTALKPTSEEKVLIISYNGRGAVTKAIKPLEASSEAGLRIAAMRVKLIEAYSQSLPISVSGSDAGATSIPNRTFIKTGLPSIKNTALQGLSRNTTVSAAGRARALTKKQKRLSTRSTLIYANRAQHPSPAT